LLARILNFTSTQRTLLILAITTVFATSFSVSAIYVTDLALPNYEARIDNYAFAFFIPLAASPLLIYPMLYLQQRMEQAQAALEYMARTDVLTGVSNRRGFFEAAEADFGGGSQPVALMMVDIDHFKRVNDLHGHAAGDELLKRTAQLIELATRDAEGVVGRIGGEEFAVLLRGVDGRRGATLADSLCHQMRALRFSHHGSEIGATLSVGLAFRQGGEPLDAVMRRADMAAYAAKRAGRDRWACADDAVANEGSSAARQNAVRAA
jgi:diguanylate cyclase (GGDEF)-like protein